MRGILMSVAFLVLACGVAWAQPAPTTTTTTVPPTYIVVTAPEMERHAKDFIGRYIQVTDSFGTTNVPFPPILANYRITPDTHFLFRTHRAMGSNMLCVGAKDNKEVAALFETPLLPATPIYLMGKVGPMVDVGDAVVPIFLVDRVVRGSTPPPAIVDEKKKPIRFVIERADAAGRRVKVGEVEIREPGKTYPIPDPYDQSKVMYMTFQF